MSKDKIISVININGFAKHGMLERVSELLGSESTDIGKYFYNSEGAEMFMHTSERIPEGTNELDVWASIWDMDLLGDIIERMKNGVTEYLPEPTEFTVDGQVYRYIGELWGYYSYSTSPDDERYEP